MSVCLCVMPLKCVRVCLASARVWCVCCVWRLWVSLASPCVVCLRMSPCVCSRAEWDVRLGADAQGPLDTESMFVEEEKRKRREARGGSGARERKNEGLGKGRKGRGEGGGGRSREGQKVPTCPGAAPLLCTPASPSLWGRWRTSPIPTPSAVSVLSVRAPSLCPGRLRGKCSALGPPRMLAKIFQGPLHPCALPAGLSF